MATKKITEKTVAEQLREDTHFLTTQTEDDVHSLRRVPKAAVLGPHDEAIKALHSIATLGQLNRPDLWSQGAIVATTGKNTSSTSRIRTSLISGSYLIDNVTTIRTTLGGVQVFAYNTADSNQYVGTFNGTDYDTRAKVLTNLSTALLNPDYNYRFVLLRTDLVFTPEDWDTVVFDSVLSDTIAAHDSRISALEGAAGTVRIATFNVGKWYNGSSKGCPTDKVAERLLAWHRFMGDNAIEIMMAQEFRDYFDVDDTIDAYSGLINENFPLLYSTGDEDRLVAARPVTGFAKTALAGSPSGAWEFDVVINSKSVHFIQTHLSTEEALDGNRATSIQALVSRMANYEYCVVAGDFNIRDLTEWQPFVDAGYKLANNGFFGPMTTLISGSAGYTNRCIDNIIVSANIKIRNAFVPEVVLSDHAPLVTDIYVE